MTLHREENSTKQTIEEKSGTLPLRFMSWIPF